MTTLAIPSWNAIGVIPPVSAMSTTGAERSPYQVSLSEVVLRFGTSPERQRILGGFLRYRGRLHAVGLRTGFQWLDGSFLENIELIESRPPNDLDVVTFFSLDPGDTQVAVRSRAPDAFPSNSHERMVFKATFFVDPYLVDLGAPSVRLVQSSIYWYSLWSHRRDASWKGYLQVGLDPAEDAAAAIHFGTSPTPGASP
jgi:hypothetical protein